MTAGDHPDTMNTDSTPPAVHAPSSAQRWLIGIGSLGPFGHMPASGTATVACVGIPAFWAFSRLGVPAQVVVAVVFAAISVWIHHHGDRILGKKDSGVLVWDELAGFLVAVIGLPFTWPLAFAAFLVERILDIAKIPPARQIEDHAPGGWGVVGDDLVAGLYTCALMHAVRHFAPNLLG